MANWLVRGLKAIGSGFKVVGKDAGAVGQFVIDSPLDDIAVGILAPSFSPQWTAIQKKIKAVEIKWDGAEGQSAVKRAEVLASSSDLLDLANESLSWTGHRVNYDTSLVGAAVDAEIALQKAVKALLDSATIQKVGEVPVLHIVAPVGTGTMPVPVAP